MRKSFAEIMQLLADNTQRQISAEDVREAIESMAPAVGGMFASGPASTDITVPATFVKAANQTQSHADGLQLFQHSPGRLTYNGLNPVICQAVCTLSLAPVFTANVEVAYVIAKNGTANPLDAGTRFFESPTDTGDGTAMLVTRLVQGDHLEIHVANNTNAAGITIHQMKLTAYAGLAVP